MSLTPPDVRPWLGADSRNRSWPGHGAMMVRRAEALDRLSAASGSWLRFGLAALAWALGAGGAVLVGRGAAEGGSATAVGAGLLVVATVLGGVVVVTGSSLARATAAWWTLATAVRADGGRVDATTADPDTRRAHEDAVARDRAAGVGELLRPPLLPRTLAVLLLVVAAVMLGVQAALGYAEASTPYAADDVRGAWLTRVVLAVVCLLPALVTASGLRRVHRARMHRVAHSEPAAPEPAHATLTPALGSGAIVVSGVLGRPAPGGPTSAPPAAPAGPVPPLGGTAPDGPVPPPAPLAAPSPLPGPPAASPVPPPVPETAPEPGEASPGSAPQLAPAERAAALPHEPQPRPAEPSAGPAPAAAPRPKLRLSDGRALGAGTTLVGRAPRPRSEEHVDALLAVADERVSKTHLTVRVADGTVVVADRGSSNGTVVHRPDGSTRSLPEGEFHELDDGDVVVLGSTTLVLGDPPEDVEHTVLRPRDG